MKIKEATVRFIGVKPILFDRYQGSNEAQPDNIDKVYWHDGLAVIPQINLYSGLSAENTKSVAKMYFGKKAKPIGMAINNGLAINELFPILKQDGNPVRQEDFDKKFEIVEHVARINKSGTAIPNPKVRPMLGTPWELEFGIRFLRSGDLTWEVMTQCFQYLGMIGIGTYRPLYGGFQVEIQEK